MILSKVRAALAGLDAPEPLGPLRIDPATNHANLPFLLGRISGLGLHHPSVAAEPLSRTPISSAGGRAAPPRRAQPQLRIVS